MIYNAVYSVEQRYLKYIIKKQIPGKRALYLKSIYNGICVYYHSDLWAKEYKTEKAAWKVIDRIITEGINNA